MFEKFARHVVKLHGNVHFLQTFIVMLQYIRPTNDRNGTRSSAEIAHRKVLNLQWALYITLAQNLANFCTRPSVPRYLVEGRGQKIRPRRIFFFCTVFSTIFRLGLLYTLCLASNSSTTPSSISSLYYPYFCSTFSSISALPSLLLPRPLYYLFFYSNSTSVLTPQLYPPLSLLKITATSTLPLLYLVFSACLFHLSSNPFSTFLSASALPSLLPPPLSRLQITPVPLYLYSTITVL